MLPQLLLLLMDLLLLPQPLQNALNAINQPTCFNQITLVQAIAKMDNTSNHQTILAKIVKLVALFAQDQVLAANAQQDTTFITNIVILNVQMDISMELIAFVMNAQKDAPFALLQDAQAAIQASIYKEDQCVLTHATPATLETTPKELAILVQMLAQLVTA